MFRSRAVKRRAELGEVVKKNRASRLHIAARVVELRDLIGQMSFECNRSPESQRKAMRRLLILTALTAMTATAGGCHLFNRGSSCGQQPQATYGADPCLGAPTVTEGTTVLPGPTYSP
jgi:hypothetical protein